jgi:peptide/nickel transport system substrate-binding protein
MENVFRRRSLGRLTVGLIAIGILAACAPARPAGTGSGATSAGQSSQPSRALAMAVRYEPLSLASKPLRDTGSGVSSTTRLFNAELDLQDGKAVARPYLAEALPQLNTDTWRVTPDGRMETRYTLKPSLTWHDGTALSAEDFAFAWRIYREPTFSVVDAAPLDKIEDVVAPDARTVIIRWKETYPDAGSITTGFQALPRHILQSPFERLDPEAFIAQPYWTTEYVGLGPYKVRTWSQGSHVEGTAFEGHALGKTKIERITVKFFNDENVAFTNLLAGEVQYATGRALRFEHGAQLRRDWGPSNKGSVLFTPDTSRFVAAQFRPELVASPGLLDVRTRRAIAHAIDRDALNLGIFEGEMEMSDLFLTRYSRYERVNDMDRALNEANRTVTHYPYDERISAQLMTEAGFTKGRDGMFANASGEHFPLPVWSHTSPQYEKELQILVDSWRRAGLDAQPTVLPTAALRDGQLRASFPALYIASSSRLESFISASVSGPTNRWTGSNRGAWVNPEYDWIYNAFNTTLDPETRITQAVQMLKILSDDIPAYVLYFNPSVAGFTSAVKGPDNASLNTDLWNIHEWVVS